MNSDKKEDPLPYATPTPPRAIPLPYFLFAVCMILLIIGIAIGSTQNETVGLLLGIPSALGSIVLPIVSQMRER